MPPKLSGPLAGITVDDILSEATCEPISLANFEAFLLYKQHSVECLRFVIWYKSYSKRFYSLPLDLQSLSPPVTSPGPVLHLQGNGGAQSDGLSKHTSFDSNTTLDDGGGSHPIQGINLKDFSFSGCSSPTSFLDITSPLCNVASAQHHTTSNQPFRWECACIAHTFLIPSVEPWSALPSPPGVSSTAELLTLNLSSTLLDTTLSNLEQTTHPSAFQAVYDHTYDMLRSSSLPYFLADAESNINHDKTKFWQMVGVVGFLIGWAIVLLCLLIESAPDPSKQDLPRCARCWRLFSVPFFVHSGFTLWFAHRGICASVWGRNGTQLRPWELAVPSLPPQLPACENIQLASEPTAAAAGRVMAHEARRDTIPRKAMSHPFADTFHLPTYPPHRPTTPFDSWTTRVRIFGPERSILDPRIREAQKRIVREARVICFTWGVFWTVIVLCIPSRIAGVHVGS